VTDATGTLGTALGVEGLAMQQGAAEDVAEVGEPGEEAVEVEAQRWHRKPIMISCQDSFTEKCLEICSVLQPAGQPLYGNEGLIPSFLRRKRLA
jgi:hypothetical protein